MDGEKAVNPDTLPPNTPVVIYVRVSSEEQVDGYSLSAQERFCREFAEKRHWDVVKIYSDPGHSGKNDRRPGFQNMIADAEQHQFKAILIHKLDRFSRNIENSLKYFKELSANDVTIASVTEDFDFTTAQGRLFFRMMALFAQWYLENLSAEVVKGKWKWPVEAFITGVCLLVMLKMQKAKLLWFRLKQKSFGKLLSFIPLVNTLIKPLLIS
jgi:hypothetical protein